ncbi:autoinducer binding domain-containing protein [Paracoccus sp. (in: a-proteobacteria)]|uniref:helix-turn-helix transcriptional regulator n=1 Tax=Paracoccus sp. TaxID=267 RepID=UPI0026E10C2A|nr:autoinducer binding domain-containing protein [Paracoccus sp. (in: a-proteobacteria)]MDO5648089.1 autoinducer binding domain-containing protein [Paracoccus sp. (in: a-proteobacteria)]
MAPRPEINAGLKELEGYAPSGYFLGLHIRFAAPLLQVQTYSEDWSQFYSNNGYALRDPTIAWGFSTLGACRWSALPVPDPFDILQEAAAHGMTFGVTVSCGPISSRTIASFTRSDREYLDNEIEHLVRIVHHMHELVEPPASLTKAQVEALRCVAEGHRHAAAAARLGITESAFKARLISVRDRLNARTTAEALQRAKEYRLL